MYVDCIVFPYLSFNFTKTQLQPSSPLNSESVIESFPFSLSNHTYPETITLYWWFLAVTVVPPSLGIDHEEPIFSV